MKLLSITAFLCAIIVASSSIFYASNSQAGFIGKSEREQIKAEEAKADAATLQRENDLVAAAQSIATSLEKQAQLMEIMNTQITKQNLLLETLAEKM